jgi:hypothetical protein
MTRERRRNQRLSQQGWIETQLAASFRGQRLLRGAAQRALRLSREALEPFRIIHRQIGENLAIQFHACGFQTVDELAVAQAVQLGSPRSTASLAAR